MLSELDRKVCDDCHIFIVEICTYRPPGPSAISPGFVIPPRFVILEGPMHFAGSSSAMPADERVLDVAFSDDALSVSLRDGRVISVPLAWYPLLLNATPAQRKNWKIAGGGYGIHRPEIDEDLSMEGLLRAAKAAKAHAPAK
jgi:hypothetical protein